ncbi:MAG TPA: SCO family protein [Solirubrobacterales bacterium]|nr:SCO family protein [Solirubrobacterales bacterium]
MRIFPVVPKAARYALPLLAILVVALLLGGCGGGSSSAQSETSEKAQFAGAEASPPKAAAPLRLHNYLGEPVDLASYKGKAVLITFIYTHCPDVCPLIVSHIKTAQALLGPKAKQVQVIAVSTDPRGDTPKTVAKFLKEHGMTGRMQYLVGNRAELGHVWKEWGIVAKPAKAGRDLVEHSALIYGIGANGKVTTLYPANFRPAQLVHDVPLLAEQ